MAGKVLFVSKGLDAASTRYRAAAFFPALEQAGWQVEHCEAHGGLSQKATLLKACRAADVVVVLRRTFSAPFRALLRKAAHRLVFDFDDAIFTGDDGEPSRSRERGFEAMMRHADQVWAGNSFLAEQAGRINGDVKIMPTVLDVGRYHVAEPQQPEADAIDLVWIGSSATRKYLEAAVPMLQEAMAADARLRLKIIADFDLAYEGLNRVAVAWSSQTEADDLAGAHIGIAPMSEDIWTRGKCGFKIIQYMAAGLPVIASDVGANSDIVIDGKTGLLVSDPAQWRVAIEQLVADASRRRSLGLAGRQRAVEMYDLKPAADRMLECLATLTS